MKLDQSNDLLRRIWELKHIVKHGHEKAVEYKDGYAQTLALTVNEKLDSLLESFKSDPPKPMAYHDVDKYKDMVIDGRYR